MLDDVESGTVAVSATARIGEIEVRDREAPAFRRAHKGHETEVRTPQPEPSLDVERLAIAAAARLEGEVSRLRTELAACTEAQSTLDAERLAQAFTIVQPGVYGEDWPRDDPDDFQFVNAREHAAAIAAEYARLAVRQRSEERG